jgi:hypothetical protein
MCISMVFFRMRVTWRGSVAFCRGGGLTCLEGCEVVKMRRLAHSELHYRCPFHQAMKSIENRVSKPTRYFA